MTDITDAILNGEIEALANVNGIFGYVAGQQGVDTSMLHRGTMQLQNNPRIRTARIDENDISWRNSCNYHSEQLLTYILHEQSELPGVNILEIPLDEQNENITFPCFVSSGRLSGCVYAWFLLEGKIVFLHAGADGNSAENENTEERRCKERADIFNGLRYCMGDRTEPVTVCLSTEELLKKIQGLVKAGQIIYPSEKVEKKDMGMIQTMSYTESNTGESLCIITIITGSKNTTKISGMMTEKEGASCENLCGRILKVDELGNEIH